MSAPKVIREEIVEGANSFTATAFELDNAALVFFDEKTRLRLGTLSFAMPRVEREAPSLASVLLGDRNVALSRIIAEQLAAALGKIILSSVFVQESSETVAGPILLRLVKRLVESMKKQT